MTYNAVGGKERRAKQDREARIPLVLEAPCWYSVALLSSIDITDITEHCGGFDWSGQYM